MKFLLKKGKIIDAESPYHQQIKDILIDNDVVLKIADTIEDKESQVVELPNLHISKGWFDSSVCFGEPGYEERETLQNGLKTAALSGFTSIAINPNVFPVNDNQSTVNHIKNSCKNSAVDISPIGSLTLGAKGEFLSELYDMNKSGAFAFGDYKKSINEAKLLKSALEYTQFFKGLVISYPSDESLSRNTMANEGEVNVRLGLFGNPPIGETIQIARDLALLKHTGGKLHIPYITTSESVEYIKKAKREGLDISCSTSIFHLFFDDSTLEKFDSNFKFNPPLRTKKDIKALRKGVEDGTIDFVTSMHEPVNIEHKEVEFETALDGSIGLEAMFGVLNTLYSIEKTIEILTRNKERFGFEKSSISENQKANLTLFNPELKYTFKEEKIYSTSKNCAFLDTEIKGESYGVLNSGKLEIK